MWVKISIQLYIPCFHSTNTILLMSIRSCPQMFFASNSHLWFLQNRSVNACVHSFCMALNFYEIHILLDSKTFKYLNGLINTLYPLLSCILLFVILLLLFSCPRAFFIIKISSNLERAVYYKAVLWIFSNSKIWLIVPSLPFCLFLVT